MEEKAKPMAGYDFRKDFTYPDDLIYLNSAAETILLEDGRAGLMEFIADKSRGEIGRQRFYEVENECRAKVGRLLQVPPKDIALLSSTSEGINAVMQSLAWHDGDNVVITDLDFPSGVVASLRLAKRGVKTRVVKSRDGRVALEDIVAAIDSRTRLVSISLVSYRNGFKFNLQQLSNAVKPCGPYLLVDAMHALGATKVEAEYADFLVSGTYKWLLGITGGGIFYCNPRVQEELEPASIGWYSVAEERYPERLSRYTLKPDMRRFQAGNADFAALYVLNRSLDYIHKIGLSVIEQRLEALTGKLVEGLEALPVKIITPVDPAERAGIVSFEVEDGEKLVKELWQRRIRVYYPDGVVRVSPYLYNTEEEIETFLKQVGDILQARQ